jgi:hypothetical protein
MIAFVQQDAQFITAQAAEQIAAARHMADFVGNLPQERITCLVSVQIVHVLEAVEIEIEQRPVTRRTAGAG